MMHWRLSEGNIDMITGVDKKKHVNFLSTVEFYKHKIETAKREFQEIFEEQRRHDTVVDDGTEWLMFEEERVQRGKFPEDEKVPDFEEGLIVDTIRAIRQDRKGR